jgi:uncharacterized protein (DUF2062 family)
MFQRLKVLIMTQLTQGTSVKSLALSGAIALTLGTFPVAGATTIVIFFTALYLRLNQPLMQTLNQMMTPLFLIMLPIYVRVGEWIVGAPPVSINPRVIIDLFFSDWRLFFAEYGWAAVHAILAWTIIAPPLGFVVYFALLKSFSRIQRRFGQPPQLKL